MNNLEEIVDRAIDYTNIVVQQMPSYRAAALSGLTALRHSLAGKNSDDPAVRKLDSYLDGLGLQASDEKR